MKKTTLLACTICALLMLVPLHGKPVDNPLLKQTRLQVYFDNQLFGFSNGDLRQTDTSSLDTVENSDDEVLLGYMELGIKFEALLIDNLRFYVDLYKTGFWGNDSAEFVSKYNNFYLREAHFHAPLLGGLLNLKLGRQRYGVSTNKQHRCYVFNDIVDAAVVDVSLNLFGVEGFIDLFSMNSPAESFYIMRSERHEYVLDNFNGDVNIIRMGLIPYLNLGKLMRVRPFLLYTRLGATYSGESDSGGAEESVAGTSGNYADNDWLFLLGGAVQINMGRISIFAEAAYSTGVDRKRDPVPDVSISGIMIHGSLRMNLSSWLGATLTGFYAGGGDTDADGNYKNYGFVSFKGSRAGGFLFQNYYGAYASAIVDYSGLSYEPFETWRRAPMMMFSLGFFVDHLDIARMAKSNNRSGLSFNLDLWFYFDTSSSSADYSRSLPSDVEDQKRLGKFMGYEADVKLAYGLYQGSLELGIEAGLFVPYDFFLLPVSVAKAPYGKDTFWGASLYTRIRF